MEKQQGGRLPVFPTKRTMKELNIQVEIFDIWRPQLPAKTITVKKIGRKWIHTSYGRFLKETGMDEEPSNYQIKSGFLKKILGQTAACPECEEDIDKSELEQFGGMCKNCCLPF